MMFEDLEVDLAVPRETFVLDLSGQFIECLASSLFPFGPGLRRNIIEQVIETMVAKLRRQEWPLAELLFEILLEEGREPAIFDIVGGLRCRGEQTQ
jgi:hypothetical protein